MWEKGEGEKRGRDGKGREKERSKNSVNEE